MQNYDSLQRLKLERPNEAPPVPPVRGESLKEHHDVTTVIISRVEFEDGDKENLFRGKSLPSLLPCVKVARKAPAPPLRGVSLGTLNNRRYSEKGKVGSVKSPPQNMMETSEDEQKLASSQGSGYSSSNFTVVKEPSKKYGQEEGNRSVVIARKAPPPPPRRRASLKGDFSNRNDDQMLMSKFESKFYNLFKPVPFSETLNPKHSLRKAEYSSESESDVEVIKTPSLTIYRNGSISRKAPIPPTLHE